MNGSMGANGTTPGHVTKIVASTIPGDDPQAEEGVLRRLSHEFELCQYGLREVRREWERRDDEGGFSPLLIG